VFDGYRELSAKGERYLLMRGCGAGNVLPMMPGCLMLLLKSLRLTGLLPTTTVYIYRRKHIKYSFIVHCYSLQVSFRYRSDAIHNWYNYNHAQPYSESEANMSSALGRGFRRRVSGSCCPADFSDLSDGVGC
jgi:hypothetical protein